MTSNNLTKEEIDVIRNISIHKILGIPDTGRPVKMLCPFHVEDTPSFYLRTGNRFKCFGCGAVGTGAIDFTCALGYSFTDALEELSEYL